MKSFGKVKKLKSILFTLSLLLIVGYVAIARPFESQQYQNNKESNVEIIPYKNNSDIAEMSEANTSVYLSDITPIAKSIGHGKLLSDIDSAGNKITLKVENNWFSFDKGIFAHAKSTLVYDLTEYINDYNYFVAFVGLNKTAASTSNGVIYHFYLSNDNSTWTEVNNGILKKPGQNATYVEVPLNGYKYLKIFIDDNKGNGNDHSVLGDARLVKDNINNFAIPSAEYYSNQILQKYPNQTEINDELKFLLLKREFVNRVGQYTLNSFYNTSSDNKDVINWLMNNQNVLNYYILGGTPRGSFYYNSLTELSRLYRNYKNDFSNTEVTKYGTVYGDLYTRMAISLSLTHSDVIGLWMNTSREENKSDSVRRYAIFKYMHKNDLLKGAGGADIAKWFEDYTVAEMRLVMVNSIDDESILWLNAYTQEQINKRGSSGIAPHIYIAYVWPNYGNSVYYAEENIQYFNELFSVPNPNNNGERIGMWDLEYKIPGGIDVPEYTLKVSRGTPNNKIYKVWMNMRNKFGTGAVCGGISKTGVNIKGVHGIPAIVIGQPGHAAILYYSRTANGDGYWSIDNDVSGWTQSGAGTIGLLRWANAPYASGYTGSYLPLEQEVVNHNDTYELSQSLIFLADSYKDLNQKEEIYRKALAIQPLNLDAWYKLILAYNASSIKTEEQYYALAEEIAENLKYYPLPMYQILNQIKPKLTSVKYSYLFTLLQTRTLKEASNIASGSNIVLQPSITKTMANFLLKNNDSTIATFSFDGADAGKIVLSNRFNGSGVRFDYSLDGKNNWKEVSFTAEESHKLQLSQSEINSITAENDIYIHIVGVSYDEKNLYKIDITKGALINNVFANDLENRIIGVSLNTEWRYSEKDKWTSYSISSPDLTGDKKVQIREGATGTKLPSDPSEFYIFTNDNQPDTRKYIPVSNLSIHSVSTEATSNAGHATNAIDGNYNTRWHSAWNGTDTQRYIVIKFANNVNLSAVEFVPAGGGNGKIIDGIIYGSLDGENWEELTSAEGLKYTNAATTNAQAIDNTKAFEIDNPQEVRYVKIVATKASNGKWFTARAFNFYQDLTKNPHPTAGIAYSTTESTNEEVVARLVNPSTNITITNNNGSDTYVFKENGKFTFTFVDDNGKKGSAIADVTWIDKNIPTADVDYKLDDNRKVVISLDNISEDVYLLDKDNNKINYIEVKNNKVNKIHYLDKDGNIERIVEVDANGCITKITYKNTSGEVSHVAEYTTIITNGVITGEDYYDKEGFIIGTTDAERQTLKSLISAISNPLEYTLEASGDYEFKLLDKAQNTMVKSIMVNYADNIILTSDITYDITRLTNQNVVAQINAYAIDENDEKRQAVVLNAANKYVFIANGTFTFLYRDSQDLIDYNVESHTAIVSWIDKVAPTASVKYEKLANGKVKAILVNESETIKVTNNPSKEYIFNENGAFTFEFEDLAGNKGYAEAIVNSIKSENKEPINDNKKPITDDKKPTINDNTNKPSTDDNSIWNEIINTPNIIDNKNPNNTIKDDINNKDEDSSSKDNNKTNDKDAVTSNSTNESNDTNTLLKYTIGFVIILFSLAVIIIIIAKHNKTIEEVK